MTPWPIVDSAFNGETPRRRPRSLFWAMAGAAAIATNASRQVRIICLHSYCAGEDGYAPPLWHERTGFGDEWLGGTRRARAFRDGSGGFARAGDPRHCRDQWGLGQEAGAVSPMLLGGVD